MREAGPGCGVRSGSPPASSSGPAGLVVDATCFAKQLWKVRSHLRYQQPGGAPRFQRFHDEGKENLAVLSSSPFGHWQVGAVIARE